METNHVYDKMDTVQPQAHTQVTSTDPSLNPLLRLQ